MNLAGFVARTKYYAVWCMASVKFSSSFLVSRSSLSSDSYRETAFIVAGLGYNPQTKHYDASRNVRIGSIELAPNFKVSSERSFTSSRSQAELAGPCELTDSPRFLEHEHERLVEGMYLQASCKNWKETWVSMEL